MHAPASAAIFYHKALQVCPPLLALVQAGRGGQVNAEFLRITTKPLQSKFMYQLDHFSDKLLQIFTSKGGVKGKKIKEALAITDSEGVHPEKPCDIPKGRSRLVLQGVSGLRADDAERDISNTVMGIYTIRRNGDGGPEDVGIVIEGIKVMENVGSVIVGLIMLLGLMYALDLSFPDNLKYTFEFLQKVVMNLDGHKLNAKIQQLKIKLFA
ncbi:uncharacterized protein LOC117479428 [Trematomus bernacchii]|uniref:uncharacterized protein LOC117479428 n=1 Tax=Trematomus bernacchii TaxID=40690 RepID=UPI00146ACEC0|nr:uncharacterized protein LOC117479428 [Trematomus bernacchii]